MAPSVLLLHGVRSSALTWWQVGAELRQRGWEVTTQDLLGHGGRSAGGRGAVTLADLALDIDDQVDGARFDVLVGHSLGALVALTLAALRPGIAGQVLIEDPPGLGGGVDPETAVVDIEQSVVRARADPDAELAVLVAENPTWAHMDAVNVVASRQAMDIAGVAESLRATRWDLPQLVATCPLPVHLLVAEGPETALGDPDRATIIAALPSSAVTVVPSGHSIHRDRPERWIEAVTGLVADTD